MSALAQRLLERLYRARPGWKDGTTEFHEMVAGHVRPGGRLLEVGPGASNETSRYLATLGELHGVDPDDAARGNDALRSVHVARGDVLPFDDASFDAVVSNWVVEHVERPAAHLREIARVLKPGGVLAFRTTGRWHYVAVVASLTPHAFHRLVANRLRALPEDAAQPFPTRYRMNTARAVRREAAAAGLQVVELRRVEKEPSYGMAAAPLFMLGAAWERAVNATEALAFLRAAIFGVLRRPSATPVTGGAAPRPPG